MIFCKKYYSSFAGFTLLELITVVSIVGILAGASSLIYSKIYQDCCVRAAMIEIVEMVKEVKMSALDGNFYAISFDTEAGTLTMISGRGDDGKWNTADDEKVRTIRLGDKGGVRFGYGNHGPLPGRTDCEDGVAFKDNLYICNDRMTGTAGTIYIVSSSGAARAVLINSIYEGYVLWKWNGDGWEKL